MRAKPKAYPATLSEQLVLAGEKAQELKALYLHAAWQQYLAQRYLTHRALTLAANLAEQTVSIAYNGAPSPGHAWLNENHDDYSI